MAVKFKPREMTSAIFLKQNYNREKDLRTLNLEAKADGRLDSGYHAVILEDGTVQLGRPYDVIGGFSSKKTIEVFMNATEDSISSFWNLKYQLEGRYGELPVHKVE